MATQVSVDLMLFLRDRDAQKELGQALWAAFEEVSLFYNLDQQRAVFRRFYLSEREPDADTLGFLRQTSPAEGELWWEMPPSVWDAARDGNRRTYNAAKIARLVPSLLGDRRALVLAGRTRRLGRYRR